MGYQSAEHEADHGEADEGDGLAGVTPEIRGMTAAADDLGKGAIDDHYELLVTIK
jgi:hypothetical protein